MIEKNKEQVKETESDLKSWDIKKSMLSEDELWEILIYGKKIIVNEPPAQS